MKPQTTALIDQAAAADTETCAIMAGLARLEETTVRRVTPGPVSRAIVARISARALTGQLTLCPDLSLDAPQPAFWCAWAPGRLRCATCADKAGRRIHGTAEDRRCDHCRKIGPSIHRDAVGLPSVVIDFPDRARCAPPFIALFGLCPACQRADKAAQ